jgi:uncharacterized membrane protein HdeD (DUF308 family)
MGKEELMETAFVIRNWKLILVRGLISLLFGIIILAWPEATTKVIIFLFGLYVLISGIVHVAEAGVAISRKEKWGLSMVLGLLGFLIGIIILSRPGLALGALVFLIGVFLVVYGFMELYAAFELEATVGLRLLFGISGVAGIAVGVVFVLNLELGAWTVILLIGLYALFVGILRTVLAFMVRSWWKKQPPTPEAA